jgi:pimeloyl-ACP methyl ester carboxylesterase
MNDIWAQEQYMIASDGVKIHFRDSGGFGIPVLFVHGFTASIGGQWGKPGLIAGMREKNWRTIAFDLRGHGKSDRPHGYEFYAGDRMGLDAIELLDYLGICTAHIVAYSLGAHIMTSALQNRQHWAQTLCLGGSAGRWSWSEELTKFSYEDADELETGHITKHILRQMPKDKPKPSAEELEALSVKKLEGMDAAALAGVKRAMPDQAITREQMTMLSMPILGIVGTHDPQLAAFRELASFHKRVELVEVEGATHGNCPGRKEALDALDRFLKRHDEGKA